VRSCERPSRSGALGCVCARVIVHPILSRPRELRLEEEARAAAAGSPVVPTGQQQRDQVGSSGRVAPADLQVDGALMQRLVEYRTARLSEEYGSKTRAQLYKASEPFTSPRSR
jgi:hypothetical protein